MGRTISNPREAADALKSICESSRSLVFFGGAGVSTASGIPDFRSANGLYAQHFESDYSPEELLSHHVWRDDPEAFYEFYRHMMCAPDAKPNQAHLKLTELEQAGNLSAVVTQNIDGLHQMAGSKHVIELHGTTHSNHCISCHRSYSQTWMLSQTGVPRCTQCGAIVKPDVVLYEESLNQHCLQEAIEAIAHADNLIVGGTSLVVYPAAGLIQYFRGTQLIIINLDPTPQDSRADLLCTCDIAKAFSW